MNQLSLPGVRVPTLVALLIAVVACGTVASPSVVYAQDNQQRARELFQEGRTHFENEEYQQAADLFVEAYDLLDAPELLFNIGQAHRRAGNLVEAEDYLQQYLNEMADPPNEDEVVDTIVEIQQQLSAQQATISVATTPPGADVFVDDETDPRCQSPCDVEVASGEYELRAERADHHPATKSVSVDPGGQTEVDLTLEPDIPVGNLVVETDVDQATLTVGEHQVSLPHSEPLELEAGPTAMTITSGGEQLDYNIDVEAGETTRLFIPVAATTNSISTMNAFSLGFGATAFSLATAAVLTGLSARATYSDLERSQSDLGGVDPGLLAAGQRQQGIANGLWIGAAISGVVGLGAWAWEFFNERYSQPPATQSSDEDNPGVDML